MHIIFFISLFLVFFAYFGYPISLAFLALFSKRSVAKAPIEPTVTLIIAASNEEKRIRQKILNTLEIDYPRGKFQIIIASDGSLDATNDIVREYAEQGVELLDLPVRTGKENVQREAIELARGEVVVFSDVATIIEPEGIRKMVANFADPTVGCVSSVDKVISQDGKPCGEGFYVKYEMWLRQMESRVNSLVGLSGSFFAARREVCRDFSRDMQSDFRTVLNSMKLGLRGVSDPEVIGYYSDLSDSKKEFQRKIRTVLRGLTVFFRSYEFLNFFKYGMFSYQFLCHKLLRWMVPVFLFAALLSNLLLAIDSFFYYLVLLPHAGFYLIAIWGSFRETTPSHAALKVPLYFMTVNAAILLAWWKYLRGNRTVMWAPSQR